MTDSTKTHSETEALLAMLAGQRAAFRAAADGLTEQQVRSVPSASSLSLAALVKHAIDGESTMTDRIAGVQADPNSDPVAHWLAGWQVGDDETIERQLTGWDEAAARTERIVRAEADLGRIVELPDSVRQWMPVDGAYTVRWLLLHELEELARHAGHADILRESIDGAIGHLGKQRPTA